VCSLFVKIMLSVQNRNMYVLGIIGDRKYWTPTLSLEVFTQKLEKMNSVWLLNLLFTKTAVLLT